MSYSGGKQEDETEAEETAVKWPTKHCLPEDDQKPGPSLPRKQQRTAERPSQCVICQNDLKDAVSFSCGHQFCKDCLTSLSAKSDKEDSCPNCGLQEALVQYKQTLKTKCESVSEGTETGKRTPLNRMYTELYITVGHSEEVSSQHEVRRLEEDSRPRNVQETPIRCHDIFKALSTDQSSIRTVLTCGVAGVGKTFSVLKFTLDWAKHLENQEVDLLVPLSFRELNLVREQRYSLLNLIQVFHPGLQELTAHTLAQNQLLFIFDGLDESRLSLDFTCELISEVTQRSEVSVLLVNIIRGSLLPSALIWITSRPAAANQIPVEHVHRFTEVRGFVTDTQKENYFRRRFTDQEQSDRVLSHIRRSRTLHSMCQIPVFCWITATVLDHMLRTDQREALPQTLTDMYVHFLLVQTQRKRKYRQETSGPELTQDDWEVLLKLGRLAFDHLQTGNLMFYHEDLQQVGLDLRQASVYSGLCTEVFKQESLIFNRSVYCFVHLSVQEFLAAVYLHHCFKIKKTEVLNDFLKYLKKEEEHVEEEEEVEQVQEKEFTFVPFQYSHERRKRNLWPVAREKEVEQIEQEVEQVEKEQGMKQEERGVEQAEEQEVEQVEDKEKGKEEAEFTEETWDWNKFFGEDTETDSYHIYSPQYSPDPDDVSNSDVNEDMSDFPLDVFLKRAMEISLSIENGHLDLFVRFLHGLSLESNQKVLEALLGQSKSEPETIQRIVGNLKEMNTKNISPDRSINIFHCLSEMNDHSVHQQIQDFLKSGERSEPLSGIQCSALAFMLQMSEEVLEELDLKKYNTSAEGRLRLISAVRNCRRALLTECDLTETHCGVVASALEANPSELRELDLSKNYFLMDAGVKRLAVGLQSVNCQLEVLRIKDCMLTWDSCCSLASALWCNPSHLKEMDLSDNFLRDYGVEQLSYLISNPLFSLQILRLSCCSFSEIGLSALASALQCNPCHLRELDLSYNVLQDSGVELLNYFLQSPLCELHTLGLRNCRLTEIICSTLALALKSNPSHLRELNLSDNFLQDSGVEHLCGFLQSPECELRTLKLRCCCLSDSSCSALASALKSNPSHLRELDLSNNNSIQDPGVQHLCDFLQNPLCELEILRLKSCGLSDTSCWYLASTLTFHSSPALRELDLRHINVSSSGLKVLKDVQARPGNRLHILRSPSVSSCHGLDINLDCPVSDDLSSEEAQLGITKVEDFRPKLSIQSGNVSYRFRCPCPGAFHCSSTGLVFVVREGAELQYRTVQWDEALLEGAGRRAAGPLYDIECSGKALRKLHLPHCEAPEVDLSQSCLSVAHITDAGMSFIPPLRISQTHVEIEISSLSVFGLVWQWLFEKHKPISGQVLLFSTPRPPPTQTLKLNMFLLPRNISVDTVEQKQRTTTQYLDAPSKCRLVIDKHYSVVCPSAEKVQPDRGLFDMDHEPNYHPSFELRLPPESSQVSITVTEVEDSSKVWTHELDLTVLLNKNRTTTHQSDCAEAKLRSVRTEFVKNVSNPVLNQLLDRLLDKKIVNSEEMEQAKDMPRADKARHVVDVVLKKGSRAASVLIQDFCKLDPSSDLCQKLSRPDL